MGGMTSPDSGGGAGGDPLDDEDEVLAKFAKWDTQLASHWGGWIDEAKECFDMVAGDQWDEDTKARMMESGRQPVTFNRMGTIIDAVVGSEIQGRQQVQYYPRQQGAAGLNELLTKGAEWIRDQSDMDSEESDAFRDTFICGMGWTESRMDYEEDPEGKIVCDRVDPLEMLADPSARKPNLTDARYIRRGKKMSQDAFEDLFPEQAAGDDNGDGHGTIEVDPRHRYDGDNDNDKREEVTVYEYQWFEVETVHLVEHPHTGQVIPVAGDDFGQLQDQAEQAGVQVRSQKIRRRRYYRAFVSGKRLLEPVSELPDGEFTFKAITGKRDRNKGVWYGLARPMMDPQRWANKFFSQMLHILNTNAKGGLVMEEGAVADTDQFEKSWADGAAITYVQPGALSGNRIQPKTPPPMPASLAPMMEMSVTAVRDTSGVNLEMLGAADREQAGILEEKRKQSAYGILAAFFESFRRYRKLHGRLLLKMIQKYLPPDYLVKITGDDGLAQYVPLVKQDDAIKFDVIVDEAPSSPNEKEKVFQMLMQFQPMLQGATPEIMAELVKYSPLPEALSQKLAAMIMAQSQPDPAKMQMEQAGAAADLAVKQSTAQVNTARASELQARAGAVAGGAGQGGADDAVKRTTAMLNVAKTTKLQTEAAAQGAYSALEPTLAGYPAT